MGLFLNDVKFHGPYPMNVALKLWGGLMNENISKDTDDGGKAVFEIKSLPLDLIKTKYENSNNEPLAKRNKIISEDIT